MHREDKMRELRFKVNGQKIEKDAACSFSGIAPGTRGYLCAVFSFGSDWSGMAKVAVFRRLGTEIPVRILGDRCMVPEEAAEGRTFRIRIVGRKSGVRITTNSITIIQEGT